MSAGPKRKFPKKWRSRKVDYVKYSFRVRFIEKRIGKDGLGTSSLRIQNNDTNVWIK